jgi:hypothetical protein
VCDENIKINILLRQTKMICWFDNNKNNKNHDIKHDEDEMFNFLFSTLKKISIALKSCP